MNIKSTFESWNCEDQTVFLRADLNVPLSHGTILGDNRLKAIQPTLDALLRKKAIVVLATHIGRPKNTEPELSTKHLVPWFEKKGYTIRHCANLEDAKKEARKAKGGDILLFENLRFFKEEKDQEAQFIQQLHSLASWYVLDAFGTLHRDDASLAPLANTYEPSKRSVGFLVQNELSTLNKIKTNPKRPLTFILGGGKVQDKLPLIEHLIETSADYILLCPALVFTFSVAKGDGVGKSLIDEKAVAQAQTILEKAEAADTRIVFPIDYQIAQGSIDGPLSFVSSDQIPADGIGVSIGPATLQLFNQYLQKSGTIFYNGMMGFPKRPDTLQGIENLLKEIATSSAYSVVAGGESVLIVDKTSLKGINYCSTGGGATLTYLSGKPLPALIPFLENGTESDKA